MSVRSCSDKHVGRTYDGKRWITLLEVCVCVCRNITLCLTTTIAKLILQQLGTFIIYIAKNFRYFSQGWSWKRFLQWANESWEIVIRLDNINRCGTQYELTYPQIICNSVSITHCSNLFKLVLRLTTSTRFWCKGNSCSLYFLCI